jgi:signal transduction histidine kinase
MDDFTKDVAAIGRISAVPTILEVVCRMTGMGFAAVARVTETRWIACSVRDEIEFGLEPGGELKVETTICDEIRASGEAVVIDHVEQDDAFCGHPTPAMYGFQSYISVPILRPNGEFFGTLCAIDPKPAKLKTPQAVGMFKLFADLIGFHLDSQDKLERSEAALTSERQLAELREQFIAVLGHDLRNPLASIDAGVTLIRKTPLDEKATKTVTLIQDAVRRMARLIDNLLDFARGQLGGGLVLNRSAESALRPALEHVLAEFCVSRPERVIDAEFSLHQPVNCDVERIGQLFSNLVANALTHGDPAASVVVRASTRDTMFELTVANAGEPIPAEVAERLFQPYFRAASRRDPKGLGLGLFIASEIARAHGGTLAVSSTADATQFTFRMPLA